MEADQVNHIKNWRIMGGSDEHKWNSLFLYLYPHFASSGPNGIKDIITPCE